MPWSNLLNTEIKSSNWIKNHEVSKLQRRQVQKIAMRRTQVWKIYQIRFSEHMTKVELNLKTRNKTWVKLLPILTYWKILIQIALILTSAPLRSINNFWIITWISSRLKKSLNKIAISCLIKKAPKNQQKARNQMLRIDKAIKFIKRIKTISWTQTLITSLCRMTIFIIHLRTLIWWMAIFSTRICQPTRIGFEEGVSRYWHRLNLGIHQSILNNRSLTVKIYKLK